VIGHKGVGRNRSRGDAGDGEELVGELHCLRKKSISCIELLDDESMILAIYTAMRIVRQVWWFVNF